MAGRPKSDDSLVRKTVFLPPETIRGAEKIGEGSLRDGIVTAVKIAEKKGKGNEPAA